MQNNSKPPATPAKNTIIERFDDLYEYDREPEPDQKLHRWKTFIAKVSFMSKNQYYKMTIQSISEQMMKPIIAMNLLHTSLPD